MGRRWGIRVPLGFENSVEVPVENSQLGLSIRCRAARLPAQPGCRTEAAAGLPDVNPGHRLVGSQEAYQSLSVTPTYARTTVMVHPRHSGSSDSDPRAIPRLTRPPGRHAAQPPSQPSASRSSGGPGPGCCTTAGSVTSPNSPGPTPAQLADPRRLPCSYADDWVRRATEIYEATKTQGWDPDEDPEGFDDLIARFRLNPAAL